MVLAGREPSDLAEVLVDVCPQGVQNLMGPGISELLAKKVKIIEREESGRRTSRPLPPAETSWLRILNCR